MYVTLNSENQPDNADFTNYFNDTMTIQPNSYICLSSLGLSKEDTDFDLGSVTAFNLRIAYGSLDFSENIQIPADEYTAEKLCDTINNLIKDLSPVWTCKFSAEIVENVGHCIVVRWFRADNFIGVEKYAENFLGDNKREAQMGYAVDPIGYEATIANGGEVFYSLFFKGMVSNNFNYVVAPVAPTGLSANPNSNFRTPLNQIGRNIFQLNRDQGEIQFTVATPVLQNKFFVKKPGAYFVSGSDGHLRFVDNVLPTDLSDYSLLEIDFKGNVFDVKATKRDNTVTNVLTDFFYQPGASFHIKCVANPAGGIKNAYALKATMQSLSTAQIGWIPFDSADNSPILPDTPLPIFDTADWQVGGRSVASYQASEIGDMSTGIRMGATIGEGNQDFKETVDFIFKSTAGNFTKGTAGNMPNGRSLNFDRLDNQCLEIFSSAKEIQMPKPCMISMGVNFTNDGQGPAHVLYGCASEYFYDLRDGNTWAVSIGGWNGTFALANRESYYDFVLTRDDGSGVVHYYKHAPGSLTDWNIWFNDPTGQNPIPAPDNTGTLDLVTWVFTFPNANFLTPTTGNLRQMRRETPLVSHDIGSSNIRVFVDNNYYDISVLLNGTGNAWTSAYGNDYYISVVANGGSNELYAFVRQADEEHYWGSVNIGSRPVFDDLVRIGADCAITEDPGSYNRRLGASVFDWRLFMKNDPVAGNYTETSWRDIHLIISNYSLGISDSPDDTWMMNPDVINGLFDGASLGNGFDDYAVLDQGNQWYRNDCVFVKTDSVAEVANNWYAVGDFLMPMQRTLNNINRTNDIVVQGQASHTEENPLKVHTDDPNNILVKGQTPSAELLTERDYTTGNPAVITGDYLDLTTFGPDNPIVTMNGDEIDSVQNTTETVINVEITNLPHRTFNGRSNNISKSIYEVPISNANTRDLDDVKLVGFVPPTKIWHKLNNPAEIPLNQLEVKISDERLKKVSNLRGPTNVGIEIKTKEEIF